jgi:hypothetical protein
MGVMSQFAVIPRFLESAMRSWLQYSSSAAVVMLAFGACSSGEAERSMATEGASAANGGRVDQASNGAGSGKAASTSPTQPLQPAVAAGHADGSSGAIALSASASAAASSAGAGVGGSASSAGGSVAPAGAGSGGTAPTDPSTGGVAAAATAASSGNGPTALPPITDAGAKGPLEIQVQDSLPGLDTHILIAPKELGQGGLKHPIVVWINGAGANSSSYRAMLDNVAAHGFFILDDKSSGFDSAPEVAAQSAAIDWVIAQADMPGGPYAGKLDTARIAIAGHSLGSVSTFGNVKDPRIKTSIHMAGGITGNPEGVDESWLQGLHVPATFLVGSADSNGLPRCKDDFAAAPPAVPLFFGILAGVGHTDEFSKDNGGRWGRVLISWLRWQLAGDTQFAKAFQGPDCEFCSGDWTAMKHTID